MEIKLPPASCDIIQHVDQTSVTCWDDQVSYDHRSYERNKQLGIEA